MNETTTEGKLAAAEAKARPVCPVSVTLSEGIEDTTWGQRYIEVWRYKDGCVSYRYNGSVTITRKRALELIEEATE